MIALDVVIPFLEHTQIPLAGWLVLDPMVEVEEVGDREGRTGEEGRSKRH